MFIKYPEKILNKKCISRETKWDLIRRKHGNIAPFDHKSEAVQRLIMKDFIGQNQRNIMNGSECSTDTLVNPNVIMELRHKMVKEKPKKPPQVTVTQRKSVMDSCRQHNIHVRDRYYQHKLKCYREHLARERASVQVNIKGYPWLIDNTPIKKSLDLCEKTSQEFYETPLVALKEFDQLISDVKQKEEDLIMANREIAKENPQNEENIQNPLKVISENLSVNRENIMESDSSSGNNQNSNHAQIMPITVDDENIMETEGNIFELKKNSISLPCSISIETLEAVITSITNEALMEIQNEKENLLKSEEANDNGVETLMEKLEANKKEANDNDGQEVVPEAISEIQDTGILAKEGEEEKVPVITCQEPVNEEKENNGKIVGKKKVKICMDPKRNILLQCFLKWVQFTSFEKIRREYRNSRADRIEMIDALMKSLQVKKKTAKEVDANTAKGRAGSFNNTMIAKKYQTKIKIQQDIIDMQRSKLERQERLIMELKLSKIAKESEEAKEELEEELKSIVRTGDAKMKAKAKCLQVIGNLKDEEDNEHQKRLYGIEMPKFLRRMQERALERSIKHEQVKQRRLRLEAEREAKKLAAEEARRMEDEKAKRARLQLLKEKRLQERMEKELREREKQRAIENNQKAVEFWKRTTLRHGIEGFKKLVQRKREVLRILDQLKVTLYKRTCFQFWFEVYHNAKMERHLKADDFYRYALKRRMLELWLEYTRMERSKFHVAIDWYDLKLTDLVFGKWRRYSDTVRMIENTKMTQAASHHEWYLKWKVLDCWRRLPQILKLERETEERRQKWRLKIWELIPDYTPNYDELPYS